MKQPIGKRVRKQYDRFMSIQEFHQILNYLKRKAQDGFKVYYKFYLLFLTQAALTLRICEAAQIQIFDIEFGKERTTVKVRLAKSDKIRTKVVPQRLAVLLYQYCIEFKEEIAICGHYIFFSYNHISKTQYISQKRAWQVLRRAVESIWGKGYDKYQDVGNNKYRIGTHSIRRLSITELVKASSDIFFVQDWVGHENVEVTQKYFRYTRLLENQVKQIDKLFDRIEKPIVNITDKKLVEDLVDQKVRETIERMMVGLRVKR